jgi:predicted lipid carrier protein YhbT
MAAFLSDEWFALVRDEGASLPARPGLSLVMQHIVAGAPQAKKLQAVVEIRDGQVVAAEVGKRADATCTLTWDYADALAALRGDLDIDVAFMRGDLKVDGDYVTFLLEMRTLFDDSGAKVLEAVRAATEG